MQEYINSPTFWLLGLGGALSTLLLTPLVMRFATLIGAVDRGGHRKLHQGRPMPLLGGLAIGIPFIAVCVLGATGATAMFRTIAADNGELWALAVGSLAILGLGLVDDRIGLGARTKFVGQFLVAAMMVGAGHAFSAVEVPGLGLVQLGAPLGAILTVMWIVGLTNAYNLVDGIDGLASGLALIGALGLAVIAMMYGMTFAALLCVALAGSLVGFLFFNFPPARVFLGDTGSMFLGFVLANITVMSSLKSTGTILLLAPMLVLALPILDTFTSMARRYVRGRPIFAGDQGHMHHRLLRMGYTPRQAALTLYAFAAALAVTSVIAVHSAGDGPWFWGASTIYGVAITGLIWRTGYLTPTSWKRLSQGRRRNGLLNAFANYCSTKLSGKLGVEDAGADYVVWLICQELCLQRLVVVSEDGRDLIHFSAKPDGDSLAELRRLRVLNHSGQMLSVAYEPKGLPEGLEHHDVEACLARILEKTDLHLVQVVASLRTPPEMALSGQNAA